MDFSLDNLFCDGNFIHKINKTCLDSENFHCHGFQFREVHPDMLTNTSDNVLATPNLMSADMPAHNETKSEKLEFVSADIENH